MLTDWDGVSMKRAQYIRCGNTVFFLVAGKLHVAFAEFTVPPPGTLDDVAWGESLDALDVYSWENSCWHEHRGSTHVIRKLIQRMEDSLRVAFGQCTVAEHQGNTGN